MKSNAEVVLICYQQGCGCEAYTLPWTKEAIEHKKKVVVVTRGWHPEMNYLKEHYAHDGVEVFPVSNLPSVNVYSPLGKTTASLLRYGKIVRQSSEASAIDHILN